jgi:hypothetical protein
MKKKKKRKGVPLRVVGWIPLMGTLMDILPASV